MVGLKDKIYYEVLCNISILCCFVLDCNKIVLAVYAVVNVILRVCYCNLCKYVRDIMY